MLFFF